MKGFLKIGILCLGIPAILGFAGCKSDNNVVVAQYPGGEVTRKELRQAQRQQGSKSIEQKPPELRKKALETTAREIAMTEYLRAQGESLANSEDVRIRMEVAAMEAAAHKWHEEMRKAVANELTGSDVQDYLKKHGKALKNPGKVLYYFLYVKTKGLQGKELEAKKAKVAELLKKAKADPVQFRDIVKVHSEVADLKSTNQIGPIDRELLPSALGDLLFDKLKEGEISEPFEMPDGIAVFQVSIHQRDESRSDTEVMNAAREAIISERHMSRLESEMNNLYSKYPVKDYWLDKPYEQWKDTDVVYRVGPLERTFKQTKDWAQFEESMMCNQKSAELVEYFIRRDLTNLAVTRGSGKVSKFLNEEDRMMAVQHTVLMDAALSSKQIIEEKMQEIGKQAQIPEKAKLETIDEFVKNIYPIAGDMLGLGSPGWFRFEQIIIQPRREALEKKGSIPAMRGMEAAEEVIKSLKKGADPKKPEQLLPADSSFMVLYKPPARVAEPLIKEAALEMMRNLPDNDWSAPLGMSGSIRIYRVFTRKPAMTIPYDAAKAEFVPSFKKYLALSGIQKVRTEMMSKIKVIPENLPTD